MTRRALALFGALGACVGAPLDDIARPDAAVVAPRVRNVDVALVERAPEVFSPLPLPTDVAECFAWVAPDGDALLAARDGRLFAADGYGVLRSVPAGPEVTGAFTVRAIVERGPGDPLAVTDGDALAARDGWAQRVFLPTMLRGARDRGRWSDAALWATPTGVYFTDGPQWLRLDRGGAPVTDVRAVLPLDARDGLREAWALRGDTLEAVSLRGRAVTWAPPVPGLALGPVRAIALHRGSRYIARSTDLLRLTPDGAVERVRAPGFFAGPAAMASAGPWLWMVWSGDAEAAVARYDGDGVFEVLGRGGPLRAPRISADSTRGDIAVVTDGATALRVEVAAAVRLRGFAEGAVLTSPRLALTAEPPAPWRVESVDFSVDGVRVASATAAPFVWGDGVATRELPDLAFGAHVVAVNVRYRGAPATRLTRSFTYASPIGRAPTWEADIRPIFEAHCARCHATGVARDLRGYARFRAQATAIRGAMEGRRMPPDFSVDAPTIQLLGAWIGGGLRER
jgi:hypothetical protein